MTISSVDGQNVNVGELCGVNTGQHLYIHPSNIKMVMPIMITFHFAGGLPYIYKIRVTQVGYLKKN